MITTVHMSNDKVETVRVFTPLGTIEITILPEDNFAGVRVINSMVVKSTSGVVIEVENPDTQQARKNVMVYPERSNFYMAFTTKK